jgi:flagellar protein FlaG
MSTEIKTSAPAPVEGGRAIAPKPAPKEAAPAAPDALYRADIVPMKRVELSVDPRQMAEKLKQVLAEANQQMANSKVALGFSMNEAINGPVVTVKNLQTGEVVRTIPNEVVIRVAQSIQSLKGVLFNEKY